MKQGTGRRAHPQSGVNGNLRGPGITSFLRWSRRRKGQPGSSLDEYGVQIMSPNYEADRDVPTYVPKEHWYAAPAKPGNGERAEVKPNVAKGRA
jgi:hypothetical protein